ncbi:MAG TPA: FHA domain-containing protein [Tepidisphaeraceae bacterium]|nr:FHA domain-containing protein [Tepidisphaeraceae bacterium]
MATTLTTQPAPAGGFPVVRLARDPSAPGPTGPVTLTKRACVIGRVAGVHLRVQSRLVSNVHALLVSGRDGRAYVRDLASRNGLLVNGRAVREAELRPRDVVRLGPCELMCDAGFAGAAGAGWADGAPAARVVVDHGAGGAGASIPIDGHTLLIGRRPGCDVRLDADDDAAEGVHAVVFERDGRRFVRDLNSERGIAVNGVPVRQAELSPGDDLTVGRTRVRYELEVGASGLAAGRAGDAEAEAVALLAFGGDPEGAGDAAPAAPPRRPLSAVSRAVAGLAHAPAGGDVGGGALPFDGLVALDVADLDSGVEEGGESGNGEGRVPAGGEADDFGGDDALVPLAGASTTEREGDAHAVVAVAPPRGHPHDAELPLVPLRVDDRVVGVIDGAVAAVAGSGGSEERAEDGRAADSVGVADVETVPTLATPGGLAEVLDVTTVGALRAPEPAERNAARGTEHAPDSVGTAAPAPLVGADEPGGTDEPADDEELPLLEIDEDAPPAAWPFFRAAESAAGAAVGGAAAERVAPGRDVARRGEAGESPERNAGRPPDLNEGGGGGTSDGGPDVGDGGPPDGPARRLDRIVSELAHQVADLASTWDEVRRDRCGPDA